MQRVCMYQDRKPSKPPGCGTRRSPPTSALLRLGVLDDHRAGVVQVQARDDHHAFVAQGADLGPHQVGLHDAALLTASPKLGGVSAGAGSRGPPSNFGRERSERDGRSWRSIARLTR